MRALVILMALVVSGCDGPFIHQLPPGAVCIDGKAYMPQAGTNIATPITAPFGESYPCRELVKGTP